MIACSVHQGAGRVHPRWRQVVQAASEAVGLTCPRTTLPPGSLGRGRATWPFPQAFVRRGLQAQHYLACPLSFHLSRVARLCGGSP